MDVKVKMRIQHHDSISNTYTVFCYTDRLVELYNQKVWPEKCKMLVASGRAKTEAEALPEAQRMWPAGGVWNVTDYNNPPLKGAALHADLLRRSAGDGGWLLHLEKTLSTGSTPTVQVGSEVEMTVSRDAKGNLVIK